MSSKLKVLQVIPRLDYGGAEIGCYYLAHYLSEQKSKSYIASSGGKLTKYINKKKVFFFGAARERYARGDLLGVIGKYDSGLFNSCGTQAGFITAS